MLSALGARLHSGQEGTSFRHNSQTGSGSHQIFFYSVDTRAVSSGSKRPGHEDNHLPPASAQVKNSFTPPNICLAWCLKKH
jgi:hypothetical protein